jgi:hypothetical protein
MLILLIFFARLAAGDWVGSLVGDSAARNRVGSTGAVVGMLGKEGCCHSLVPPGPSLFSFVSEGEDMRSARGPGLEES